MDIHPEAVMYDAISTKGWTDATALRVALDFIAAQSQKIQAAFADYLDERISDEEEDEEDEEDA